MHMSHCSGTGTRVDAEQSASAVICTIAIQVQQTAKPCLTQLYVRNERSGLGYIQWWMQGALHSVTDDDYIQLACCLAHLSMLMHS